MERRAKSVVTVKKMQLYQGEDEVVAEVEARVLETDALVRIHCQKQKGVLVRLLAQIQNLHPLVICSVLSFRESDLHYNCSGTLHRYMVNH